MLHSFYPARSNLGERSAAGAQRNKLSGPEPTASENDRRALSRESKARVKTYNQQQRVDLELQDYYDNIKSYPKTNSEDAMQQINRVIQKER